MHACSAGRIGVLWQKFPMRLFQRISFLAATLLTLGLPGHELDGARTPAYASRGDEVEALLAAYSSRLASYHERLKAAVASHAPELLGDLAKSHPATPGYQVLPEIVAGGPSPQEIPPGAVAYSWPWTARLIERELRAIGSMQATIDGVGFISAGSQRTLLEELLRKYRDRGVRHRNIAAHVAYNRFWQSAIAADRAAYDRETALQRLVLERQRIDARLRRARATFARFNGRFHRPDESIRLGEIERDLLERRVLLARRIDEAMGEMQSPRFVRAEKSLAGWTFLVPLFTDIADRGFVGHIQRIIESAWRLSDQKSEYRVLLEITYLPPETIAAPVTGERLELVGHLARFPARGAVLTTGGITTHVRNRAMVLGPHPVTPGTIAHEFGHVLGFRDRYVRGYKNLGRDGFQVTEIVADPADIMSASPQGVVQPAHFYRLIDFYSNTPSRSRASEAS